MAYDEYLAERIANTLKDKRVSFEEKKMMGGLCFLVDEKMCVGIIKNDLMVRLNPEIWEDSLKKKACREMDFTKRPMKGYVYVSPEGVDMEDELAYWIQLALDFNPFAKKSKKKNSKSKN